MLFGEIVSSSVININIDRTQSKVIVKATGEMKLAILFYGLSKRYKKIPKTFTQLVNIVFCYWLQIHLDNFGCG